MLDVGIYPLPFLSQATLVSQIHDNLEYGGLSFVASGN